MLLCDIRMCHFLQSAKWESHNGHTKVDTDLHYNHSAMQPAQAQATLVKPKQTVQLSTSNPCALSIKQKDSSEVWGRPQPDCMAHQTSKLCQSANNKGSKSPFWMSTDATLSHHNSFRRNMILMVLTAPFWDINNNAMAEHLRSVSYAETDEPCNRAAANSTYKLVVHILPKVNFQLTFLT